MVDAFGFPQFADNGAVAGGVSCVYDFGDASGGATNSIGLSIPRLERILLCRVVLVLSTLPCPCSLELMAKRRLSDPPTEGKLGRDLSPADVGAEANGLCFFAVAGVAVAGDWKDFGSGSSSVFGEYSDGEDATDILRWTFGRILVVVSISRGGVYS